MRLTPPADTAAHPALLEVDGLAVNYPSESHVVQALRSASFTIDRGEVLGVVGESGCGKSTLGRAILNLVAKPGQIAAGRVCFEGRDLLSLPADELRRVRGREIAMIFQDPSKSLNPVLTVGKQVAAVIEAHQHLPGDRVRELSVGLFEELGIPEADRRYDQFPHELSGGMRQRVMIAMALSNQPKVLIADEPTTALDVTLQAQILDLLRHVNSELHAAIVFISHNLAVIADICDRVLVLYAGRVVESGPVVEVFRNPRHPYTAALLGAIPAPGKVGRKLIPVGGSPPTITPEFKGCAFAPRCPLKVARCEELDPELVELSAGHLAACWVEQWRVEEAAEPLKEHR